MRYLYPLLAFLAFLLFVGATLLAVGFLVAFPFLVLGGVGQLILGRQFYAAFRSLHLIVEAFCACFRAAALLLGVVFNPLLEREGELDERGYGRSDLPELFALVDAVAREVGTRSIDRVQLTPDTDMAVFEHGGVLFFFGARRYLVLGLPFAHALSTDQLRAVLAHELSHFARGHTALLRMTGRFILALFSMLTSIESRLNPLYWSTSLSYAVLEAIYAPWQRLKEFDVDRDSARAVGSNHAISALRRAREVLPAIGFSAEAIVLHARRLGLAPTRLGEAAALLAARMDPRTRKELALQAAGDVLDYEDATHPPLAQRIAALRGVPEKPGIGDGPAIAGLPDVRKLERDLTRQLFRTGPTYLEPAPFVAAFLESLSRPPSAPPPTVPIEFGDAIELPSEPDPDPAALLGQALSAADFPRAAAAYRALPSEGAVSAQTHMDLGELAVRAGDHPTALAAFRAVARTAPEGELAARALVYAGRVYAERLSDAEAARRFFSYVVERYPRTSAAALAQQRLATCPPSA